MTASSAFACASCNALVTPEDLAQGLAVRVDGQLVCPNCVDQLPGKAQVAINKLRALKGLNATTYRVTVPGHPDHQRFTFTTAGNVLGHSRTLRTTGAFHAPLLPQGGAPRPAVPRSHSDSQISVPGPSRARPLMISALVAAVALLALIAAVFVAPHLGQTAPAAIAHEIKRSDYPAEPGEAWLACTTDRSCPPAVIEEVRQELRRARGANLDQAAAELAQGHTDRARAALDQTHLPDDPTFADLRARARELTARIAAAAPSRVVVVAPEPAATEPRPPEPEPAPPAPAGHAPAPMAPAGAGGICWTMSADDLLGGVEKPSWKPGGELVGSIGTLMRELPTIGEGAYQIWLLADNPRKRGSLTVLIDGKSIGKLEGADCADAAWRPLCAALPLAAGVHTVAIKASGLGWHVGRGYLASSDRPAPEAAGEAAITPWQPAPPATAPAPADPATPREEAPPQATTAAKEPPPKLVAPPAAKPPEAPKPPERESAVWERTFVFPASPRPEPLDGTVAIPSPWPSGAPPFQRSQRPPGAKQVQTLTLDLTKEAVDGGGVVLLLHRARADRKVLTVSLGYALPSTTRIAQLPKTNHTTGAPELEERIEDQPEKEVLPLPDLAFADNDDWQAFPIAFPDLARCKEHCWLRLEDSGDFGIDRGFLLGRVVTVAHREPSPVDLGLMAPPLIAPDVVAQKDYQRRLVGLLSAIAPKRPSRKWNDPHSFDVRKLKLLVTNPGPQWEPEMRRQLARILGLKEAPQKSILNLGLADDFWTEHQFRGSQPYVDPEDATLAVICTNGEEAGCSLKDPEALEKWMKTLIAQLVDGDVRGKRGGFLPVLVVGRTNRAESPETQQAIDLAWLKVRDDCAASGIPLIDVRGAQTEKGRHGLHELSSQLLADGLQALQYQILWVQRFIR